MKTLLANQNIKTLSLNKVSKAKILFINEFEVKDFSSQSFSSDTLQGKSSE